MFRRKSKRDNHGAASTGFNLGISTPIASGRGVAAGPHGLGPSAAAEALRRHSLGQAGANAIASFPSSPGNRASFKQPGRAYSLTAADYNQVSRRHSSLGPSDRGVPGQRCNSLARVTTTVRQDQMGRTMSLTTTTVRQMGSFEITTQRETDLRPQNYQRGANYPQLRRYGPSNDYAESITSFDTELAAVAEEPEWSNFSRGRAVRTRGRRRTAQFHAAQPAADPARRSIESSHDLEPPMIRSAIRERGSSVSSSESRRQHVSFAGPNRDVRYSYSSYSAGDEAELDAGIITNDDSTTVQYDNPVRRALAAASAVKANSSFSRNAPKSYADRKVQTTFRTSTRSSPEVFVKDPKQHGRLSMTGFAVNTSTTTATLSSKKQAEQLVKPEPETTSESEVQLQAEPQDVHNSRLPGVMSNTLKMENSKKDDSGSVAKDSKLIQEPNENTFSNQASRTSRSASLVGAKAAKSDPPSSNLDAPHKSSLRASGPCASPEPQKFTAAAAAAGLVVMPKSEGKLLPPPSMQGRSRSSSPGIGETQPRQMLVSQGAVAAARKVNQPSQPKEKLTESPSFATAAASASSRQLENNKEHEYRRREAEAKALRSNALAYIPGESSAQHSGKNGASRAQNPRAQPRQANQSRVSAKLFSNNQTLAPEDDSDAYYRNLMQSFQNSLDDAELSSLDSRTSFERSRQNGNVVPARQDYSLRAKNSQNFDTPKKQSFMTSDSPRSAPTRTNNVPNQSASSPRGTGRTFSLRTPNSRAPLSDLGHKHSMEDLSSAADNRVFRDRNLFNDFKSRIHDSDSDDEGGFQLPFFNGSRRDSNYGAHQTEFHKHEKSGRIGFKDMFSLDTDARDLLPGRRAVSTPIKHFSDEPSDKPKTKNFFKRLLHLKQ